MMHAPTSLLPSLRPCTAQLSPTMPRLRLCCVLLDFLSLCLLFPTVLASPVLGVKVERILFDDKGIARGAEAGLVV